MNHGAGGKRIGLCAGAALAMWAAAAWAAPGRLAREPGEWRGDPVEWRWENSTFTGASRGASFAIWRGVPVGRRVTLEATAIPRAILGESWKMCSVGLYLNEREFWMLEAVERPGSANSPRLAELAEKHEGVWPAQGTLKSLADEGTKEWALNQPLHFRLELTGEKIEGWIRDAAGAVVLHRAFALTEKAVCSGRPALRVAGMEAAFRDIRAVCEEPAEEPPGKRRPEFPPYRSEAKPSGIQGGRTGFFHVAEIDGRWWAVDPAGHAMAALGVDHCHYKGSWCQTLGYNPYERKNNAKYQSKEEWAEQTLARLKSWNFNLLSASQTSDTILLRRGLAHCLFLGIGTKFTAMGPDCEICPHEKRPGSAFPNVFHPQFQAWCEYQLEPICSEAADDPWLFGYFLDNEMAWWGRRTDVSYGLFDAAMQKGAEHSAKRALRDFLQREYGSAEALNAAWKTDLQSFDEILNRERLGEDDNAMACRDKEAFVALIAETYFRTVAEAIRKFDPNHMILGCRFAGGRASDAVWAACGRYCDIGTFNYYGSVDLDRKAAVGDLGGKRSGPLPETFRGFYERCGRPLMITEWSFPALDAGLPSTKGAGQRFRTQHERAEASEIYLRSILRMPFMVGSSYFMWVDEPAEGVRPEFPENSNYGLVNVDDKPYAELTAALTRVQGQAADLRRGESAETSVEHVEVVVPRVSFDVANRGPKALEAKVSVRVGQWRSQSRAALKPGEAQRLSATAPLRPGAHVARIAVNEESLLEEADPSNNVWIEPIYAPGAPWPEGAARRTPMAVFDPAAEARGEAFIIASEPAGGTAPLELTDEAGKPVAGIATLEEGRAEIAALVPNVSPDEAATIFLVEGGGAEQPPPSIRPPLRFERTEQGFLAGNGRLTIGSSDPSSGMTSEIRIDGLTAGRYDFAVNQEEQGARAWPSANQLVDALAIGGRDCLGVDLVGRFAKAPGAAEWVQPFETCQRLILFPDRPWFAAQLRWVRNTGLRPLRAHRWHFRVHSFIRGNGEDDEPISASQAPRLWKAPLASAWLDPAGGWLGALAPAGSGMNVRFWRDKGGGAHPDAAAPVETTIAPGQTWRPETPVWVLVAAGAGAREEWEGLTAELAGLSAAGVHAFEAEARCPWIVGPSRDQSQSSGRRRLSDFIHVLQNSIREMNSQERA